MRFTVAILVVVALPTVSGAQSLVPLPRMTAPLPSIGLPLPRIAAPLPAIGLPPVSIGTPSAGRLNDPSPGTHANRGRDHRRFRPARSAVYVVPVWGWDYRHLARASTAMPTFPDRSPEPGPPDAPTGRLRLILDPAATAQIYVDGFFAGRPADYDGELELTAGPHRIEIRAPGYQTVSFDVRIVRGRSITYERALEPLGVPAAPPAITPPAAVTPPTVAPVPTGTIYLIPGCYLGNVPPEEAGLPATCDLSRVTTFEP